MEYQRKGSNLVQNGQVIQRSTDHYIRYPEDGFESSGYCWFTGPSWVAVKGAHRQWQGSHGDSIGDAP